MKPNPLQFAVVREDPDLELRVLDRLGARRLLTVASGGCTALSLRAQRPELELTLVDPNPAQLDLVRRKLHALASTDPSARGRAFNVGTDDPAGLNQCGNFEALFRSLRRFLHEFVAAPEEIDALFLERGRLADDAPRLFASPWWPVAFQLFFHDALLNTMFGRAATQHAVPGSYPAYFQALFERGLLRADAFDNYFLHHVLLGRYLEREEALPPYLRTTAKAPRGAPPELLRCTLCEAPGLDRQDLVGLSNVMDWMDAEEIRSLADRLGQELRPGAAILFRQLNNANDLEAAFAGRFTFDREWGAELLTLDRSLFYQSVHVGIRSPR